MMGRVQSSTAKVKYFSTFLRSSTASCCIQQSDTHFFPSFFLYLHLIFHRPFLCVADWYILLGNLTARERKIWLNNFFHSSWGSCGPSVMRNFRLFGTASDDSADKRRRWKGKYVHLKEILSTWSRYCCTAHMFNVVTFFFLHFIRFSSTFLNDIQLNGGIVCY